MHERVGNVSGLRIHPAMLIICLLAPFVCGSDGRSINPLIADPGIDAFGMRLNVIYSDNNTLFLSGKKGSQVVDVKAIAGLDENTAECVIRDSFTLFNSQFRPQRTGYPGQHTRYIECPAELKPEYHEKVLPDGSFKYLLAYANSNRIHGACSEDLISYRSVFGFLYCRDTRSLIEVNYYGNTEDPGQLEAFLSQVSCPKAKALSSWGQVPQDGGMNFSVGDTLPGTDLSCPGCNVLLVNIELLRADYVGLISGGNRTPELDSFFNDSIIFTDVTAAAGETFRSNWATLTGMEGLIFRSWHDFQYMHPLLFPGYIDHWGDLISPAYGFPTMLEVFNESGYHTMNVNQGRRSGRRAGLGRGADLYVTTKSMSITSVFDEWVSLIGDNMNEPFFILAKNEYLHVLAWPVLLKDTHLADDEDLVFVEKRDHLRYGDPGKDPGLRKRIYSQKVSDLDRSVPVLLDVLEAARSDSIIVLYSNHGDSLGDHGLVDHGVGYQSCVHVPLIILHPSVDRQVRIEHPISLIDLAPTLYEMTGIKLSHELHGVSLVPLIVNGSYSRKFIYGKNPDDYYVRNGDLKYLVRHSTEKMLFNITADPNESIDLSGRHPQGRDMLESMLTNRIIQIDEFKRREGIIGKQATLSESMGEILFYLNKRRKSLRWEIHHLMSKYL
ncbi:sulfatase [Candidatus Altiarchaeota archaeon]